jgi:hypothetical protein
MMQPVGDDEFFWAPGRFSGCSLRYDPRYGIGHEILARHFQIIVRLEIQLELRTVTEIQAQTQRRISGDPTTLVYDLSDPVRRNTDCLGELVL